MICFNLVFSHQLEIIMHLKKRVFISRELREDSPLRSLDLRLEIVAESLLEFTPLPFSELPQVDWIFFYSQQGVRHFLDQWKPAISAKIAAFGPKTGALLTTKGLKVSFAGNGVAKNTTSAFAMLCHHEKVLFVRAKNSRKSLQDQLKGMCEINDLVVYDNRPRSNFTIPPCDLLIFTSPLNAQSYYQMYPVDAQQKVVAIGSTTKRALQSLGIQDVDVPDEPTEASIKQLLKKLVSL